MKKQIDYGKLTAEMCEKLAGGGDASAMYELSRRLDGTERKAYYREAAANAGNVRAMYELGRECFYGDGKFDADKGYEWFMKSLAAGDECREEISKTLFAIGADLFGGDCTVFDAKGIGHYLDKDKERGIKYMNKAFEIGGCDRFYEFGCICYFDLHDYSGALEFLQKDDFMKSWSLIGKMYTLGEGTPVDLSKAAEYFEKCAAYDRRYAFSDAAAGGRDCLLGYCYFCVGEYYGGDIMSHDRRDGAQAEKYYKLAKSHGYDPALVPENPDNIDFYD